MTQFVKNEIASASDEWMTIREMCKEFDVTSRALRFYEAKELLFPRREGTRRLYNKSDRARLKLILRGKRFGFSLENIRQLLNMYGSDEREPLQLRAVCDAANERLAEMKKERAEMDLAIEDLKDHIAWGENQLAQLGASVKAAE